MDAKEKKGTEQTDFSEGMIRKGGVNVNHSTPRPEPPKGQSVQSQPDKTDSTSGGSNDQSDKK